MTGQPDRHPMKSVKPLIRWLLQPGDIIRYGRARIGRRCSRRLKVGFGPIRTGRRTLSARHWHIDPVISQINRTSDTYRCDAFLAPSRLRGYDLVVFTRFLHFFGLDLLDRLKEEGVVLIYRATDYHPVRDGGMTEHRAALERMDGILVSNPLQEEDYRDLPAAVKYVGSPVINSLFRTEYRRQERVTIIWQGYSVNLEPMLKLRPILERLAGDTGPGIRFLVHTNLPSRRDGIIHYRKWRLGNWQKVLADADIAVVIKPPGDDYQQKKPPSKVISYMAAGLPVVCTPSASDRLVIDPGRTGFFAHSDEEWYAALRSLVEDAGLRERIGRAGREHVLALHGIDSVADGYQHFFDDLRAGLRRSNPLSDGSTP